jgi:hypothetical protein
MQYLEVSSKYTRRTEGKKPWMHSCRQEWSKVYLGHIEQVVKAMAALSEAQGPWG